MDAVVEARAALYEAVCKGNWSECNALLAEGTPPNFFVNGTTPLHAAAQRGRHAFLLLLLEHGADTQATDPHGFTALQCFQERHRVWGNTLLLATNASGNAHTELRERTRADAAAAADASAAQRRVDVRFDGVAVQNPGAEIQIAFQNEYTASQNYS